MSEAIRRWRQNDQRNMVVHPEGHYVAYQDHTAHIAALEAEVARLQSEQDQLLADSAIRSDQRAKYEKLCNEMATSPRFMQQRAIDAIKALCRDNERLALWRGKSREKLRAALQAHHEWHLAQDRDGGAWGIDPVDAYSESGLCEQTTAALGATP